LVDPEARKVRKIEDQQVAEPQRQAYAQIARGQFAALGDRVYPDATFTLRLAFGTVRGYEQEGRQIAPFTTLGGAYEHAAAHAHREPFRMPPRWVERKGKLDLDTPFNFVCTADITGGNSGSPVVNRRGEIVGIVFDGNRHAFVTDFAYTDVRARCVSVHSAGIVEALRHVYEAKELVEELGR
jgi:V8-like Glu-specific endopeptidase